ncbi:MAG: ABC transporter ATP-binding protein [Tatlockia sp.]|nr:ABC transporter ATP-binding protein [Tatlockia sp.]
MDYILQAYDLGKSYVQNGKENAILKNINFQVESGEFIAIMGPSGAGKSTLLYCLNGMDEISSGRLLFDKQELNSLKEKQISIIRLHKMGVIFQQVQLIHNLSILDNILMPAYLAKKEDKTKIDKFAFDLMEKMQIRHLSASDITQASGGQLQRVAICRALINRPKMIFGDEPTGALNSQSALDVMDILIDLNKNGMTCLLATHDLKVAARADKIIYILDGTIAGEKHLGKYDAHHHRDREKLVSDWLSDLGF